MPAAHPGTRAARRLAAVLALACAACGGEEPRSLLLISVDTLRPDGLGFGGNPAGTSPALDALAAEGTVFEHAFSPAGWTLPSMATLLTGLHPRDHGATTYAYRIRDSVATLPALLDDRGYDTRAFVSHILLGADYGFARGFDEFDDSVLEAGNPHDVSTSEPLTDLVLQSLERRPLGDPYFLWVHYFDPHFKYLEHPGFEVIGGRRRGRYDGEVAHTDRHIGRVLRALDDLGALDETVVVFTSDHGEEFQEHGGRFHDTLYDEVVRVPLVIRTPGMAPGRSLRFAHQIDLVPTLLPLLRIDGLEFGSGPGLDLFGPAPPADRPMFAERDVPLPFRQRSVRVGDDKLVVIDHLEVQVDASRKAPAKTRYKPRLEKGVSQFDLAADPGERVDVYREDSERSAVLMSLLLGHFDEGVGPENEVELDEETLRKLRDLGYIQ